MRKLVILGGGSAGISVAARLLREARANEISIVLIDPSHSHDYQPLWTLVGAGIFPKERTRRPMASVMPRRVDWIQRRAEEILPKRNLVKVEGGQVVHYDYLIVCPGIELHWNGVEGLRGQVGQHGICSNYSYETVDSTWQALQNFQGGRAVFTFPKGAIKCAGAPQKIMYLADEYFRRRGVRQDTEILYLAPGASIFGIEYFRKPLEEVIARKGIRTRFGWHLKGVDAAAKTMLLENVADGSTETMSFDLLHVTPPQSAPPLVRNSALANEAGWADVDKHTLQSPRFGNVFSLGDASSLPTSKTGAAIRKQAPVLVHNLLAHMRGLKQRKSYNGYASCPLVTGYAKTIMAEFDYDGRPAPSIPLLDPRRERYLNYLLKAYAIPFLYWNFMLKGLA